MFDLTTIQLMNIEAGHSGSRRAIHPSLVRKRASVTVVFMWTMSAYTGVTPSLTQTLDRMLPKPIQDER